MPDQVKKDVFKSGVKPRNWVPRYLSIPRVFLDGVAAAFEEGLKYGEFNYLNGRNERKYLKGIVEHCIAHLLTWWDNYETGETPKEDDLGHAGCNIAMLMHCLWIAQQEKELKKKPIEPVLETFRI